MDAFAIDFNFAAVCELKIFEALAKRLALIKIPAACGLLHSLSVHPIMWLSNVFRARIDLHVALLTESPGYTGEVVLNAKLCSKCDHMVQVIVHAIFHAVLRL